MTFDPTANPHLDNAETRDESGETPSDPRYETFSELEEARSMNDTDQEPAAPQEAPEPPQNETKRLKINATFARQLDERVKVMQDRVVSFRKQLASIGVVNPDQPASGVRGKYVDALAVVSDIEEATDRLKALTYDVHDTFENL